VAQHRTARLVATACIGPHARLLTLALADGGELGFSGGQYIIVNTGVELPGGKLARRAYSILSEDRDQREFRIAVMRLADGPGSNQMHRLEAGAQLEFSGPWGKFVTTGVSRGPRLVFATDTGITAALGLMRAQASRALSDHTEAVWFVVSDDYFLSHRFARRALDGLCGSFAVAPAPAVGDPSRVTRAMDVLEQILGRGLPAEAYLAGDGAAIHPLRERLLAAGVAHENIHLEAFFNNPQRRAPV
jgi:ferredoxin-NADP reductase